MKDGAKAVVCSGTSFVVRRSALAAVGNFVTESVSEDYYTGIRLAAQGYEVIYYNKKMSAGLAAESISTHISQRLRWARGTLQSLFIPSSPFTISGLNFWQRIAHLEGLLTWLSIPSRVIFLLMPLAYSFFNIIPIKISPSELIYVFLPYYLLQISAWNWLNFRSRSVIFSEISSLSSCVPLSWGIVNILLFPFQDGFKVTPKGLTRHTYSYNWKIAAPLFFLLTVTVLSIWYNFNHQLPTHLGVNLGLVWGIYNMVMISFTLLALLDKPKPEISEWFVRQDAITVRENNSPILGYLERISEQGARLNLRQIPSLSPVILEINGLGLDLPAQVKDWQIVGEGYQVNVEFTGLSLEQQRGLIEFLYCQPEQWQNKNAPGELASLWLLGKSLLKFLYRFSFHNSPTKVLGSKS
jgi:cellulose synthase (UDP-forming)